MGPRDWSYHSRYSAPELGVHYKLVAKPDQLIKRRGKAGLLALNKTWEEAKPWIAEKAGKPQKVCILSFRSSYGAAAIEFCMCGEC